MVPYPIEILIRLLASPDVAGSEEPADRLEPTLPVDAFERGCQKCGPVESHMRPAW